MLEIKVNQPNLYSRAISIFYRRHYELVSNSNFNVGLKTFCVMAYRSQNFTVTKYTNSRKMWVEVKSMQRTGTEAIRTQIQPSKPNRKITNITNSQNTKRTYGQPSEQLLSKRWPLSNRNRTKNNMKTHKVKRHRNPDTKNKQQRTKTSLPPWNCR